MSGRPTFTKKKITRRGFLITAASILSIGGFLFSWKKLRPEKKVVPGKICGAAASVGHMLRGKPLPVPEEIIETEYVIVGGGVAGLSAARWLQKSGVNDFILLELDSQEGGNAISGKNPVSAYPWGAHYLPLPSSDMKEMLDFLQENNVITGFDSAGKPVFNDYYLCFDPEERLYINGHWQDGLVPHFGLDEQDKKQVARFFDLMKNFRQAKGNDGKYAFDIPLDRSSLEEAYVRLDKISMFDYLEEEDLTSSYLTWYVDYCCRDDYGTDIRSTSAWAGIHYFAARRADPSNADPSNVLTWPEGNSFLVKALSSNFVRKIKKDSLAYSVQPIEDGVGVDFLDVKTGKARRVKAKKCIMASPQFVNRFILKAPERQQYYGEFSYAPWMVANLTLKNITSGKGAPLSWDNVFYGTESLGYVHATHQNLNTFQSEKVVSLYWPLSASSPEEERKKALVRSHEEWAEDILKELSRAHRNIRNEISNIDVWIWGHGMIRPVPGFISGTARKKAAMPVLNKIFFAHSDLSGISIFEEAFYQGIGAAKEALGERRES